MKTPNAIKQTVRAKYAEIAQQDRADNAACPSARLRSRSSTNLLNRGSHRGWRRALVSTTQSEGLGEFPSTYECVVLRHASTRSAARTGFETS